ncbi:MAG: hypothetical protein ABWX89_00715 [Paeniglutamicibacter terrestris]
MSAPSHRPAPSSAPRSWALCLGTMLVMLVVHLSSTALWHQRLPDPLATHWNGALVADGAGGILTHLLAGSFVLVLLGILMPFSARSAAGSRTGAPLLVGLGNALLVIIGGMLLSGLIGQLDAPEALGTSMDFRVLIAVLLLGIGWGVASAFLVRAALPAEPAMSEHLLGEPAAATVAFTPGTVISSTVRMPKVLLLVLGALIAALLVFTFTTRAEGALVNWSLLPATVIVLLASVLFLSGRVVVDEQGIRVYGGGLVKLLHVRPEHLVSAEHRDISPSEFGGWGLRISGAGVAFITGAGPGVIVQRKRGAARIYSVATTEDAQKMAMALNSLSTTNTL